MYSQNSTSFDGTKVQEIAGLCKVWGYLKYYHPNIQEGKINWDTTLLLTIPKVLNAKNNEEYNKIINELILLPGKVQKLKKPYQYLPKDTSFNTFDFSWITKNRLFSKENSELLSEVIENYKPRNNVYVEREVNKYYLSSGKNNYYFQNDYTPDTLHSLLSFFRYWNTINYLFVYKKDMDENWDSVLVEFIPRVFETAGSQNFYSTIAEVVAKIDDCHSYYDNYNFNHTIGVLKSAVDWTSTPITVKLVENKTVITQVRQAVALKTNLKPGDIILKINGAPIDSIRNELRIYCGCSTPVSVNREINNAIFRSHFVQEKNELTITFSDSLNIITTVSFDRNLGIGMENHSSNRDSICYLLSDSIGYMNIGLMGGKNIRQEMKHLRNTKALIIDLRNGIGDLSGLSLASRLSQWKNAVYANGYVEDFKYPGSFKFHKQKANIIFFLRFFHRKYKGKIIFLIDEHDQSNSEIIIMMMMADFNITLIGSNTSGTTGEATSVLVQNNILTYFSTSAITHNDGMPTQRVGIKPDIYVTPTIEGIRKHKDEVLERAIKFINTGI